MTKADLIALAERVERAEGPSFTLELEIFRAINPQATSHSIPNNYTASLDAAMTLVPEGHRICTISQAMSGREWFAKLAFIGREGGLPASGASSPSLALTAASLRAIAAETYTHIAQAIQHDE
ncbi:hypothetical protein [Caenibius sp. WL]|uniref:hypothetical protein n=1 Tax=Caenibius sp. WL TaxID=2872646 RepID=UPI001C9A12E4|nr:hypothetical protein [Caenibius sp. WL]QZP06849.1 hypothetical protein K5X80_08915 [Caenibius sp. WL]